MEKIREKIIELRKKNNFSQVNVAERISISQAAYHKIESGKTHLTVSQLVRIAEVFNECPGELIKLGVREKTP